MREICLKDLETGTTFSYDGSKYKKEGTLNGNSSTAEYKGLRESGCRLVLCNPLLGGKYQERIKDWFNEDTMVEV